ncbi:hypothetical protein [Nocardia sp. NPDC051570]|uniref:hypothetical protein n=1 Tax=Nocardia sp. NPDC051570 TaxID=3364324 RepID=UPI00379A582B
MGAAGPGRGERLGDGVRIAEVEVCLLWHVRLDDDPAQRWLCETIRAALGER